MAMASTYLKLHTQYQAYVLVAVEVDLSPSKIVKLFQQYNMGQLVTQYVDCASFVCGVTGNQEKLWRWFQERYLDAADAGYMLLGMPMKEFVATEEGQEMFDQLRRYKKAVGEQLVEAF